MASLVKRLVWVFITPGTALTGLRTQIHRYCPSKAPLGSTSHRFLPYYCFLRLLSSQWDFPQSYFQPWHSVALARTLYSIILGCCPCGWNSSCCLYSAVLYLELHPEPFPTWEVFLLSLHLLFLKYCCESLRPYSSAWDFTGPDVAMTQVCSWHEGCLRMITVWTQPVWIHL